MIGKPCAGYPSRVAACAALRDDEGLSIAGIAARTGLSSSTVSALLVYHDRRTGRRPGGYEAMKHKYVRVDVGVLDGLAEEAAARGLEPVELAHEILAVVARDALVAAVLDDMEVIP